MADPLDDKWPINDTKIVHEDFNVKVGREGSFGFNVNHFSLRMATTSNGMRMIDLVAGRDIFIR